MRRAELYRVQKPSAYDPKKYCVFIVVSRQVLIDSRFSTVICAPVYSKYDGLLTQVQVNVEDGLKYASSIHCDELISLPKSVLTNYVGMLSEQKITELDTALKAALDLDDSIGDY